MAKGQSKRPSIKNGEVITDVTAKYYKHVLSTQVRAGKIDTAAFEKELDRISGFEDGLSVNIDCFTTPRDSRIVWGLMKTPKGVYKEPSRFLLFRITHQELIDARNSRYEVGFKDVIYCPTNMNKSPCISGFPPNRAHCVVRPFSDPRSLVGLREYFKECESPDVDAVLSFYRDAASRRQLPFVPRS